MIIQRGHAAGFLVLFLLFVGVLVLGNVLYYSTSESVSFTVTDKERVQDCSGDDGCTSRYLVFTDVTTFEITDSVMLWRFNSSDVYGRIQPGQQCRAQAYGWRLSVFSMYQNIDDVECKKEQ